jgi:hypothetical protein
MNGRAEGKVFDEGGTTRGTADKKQTKRTDVDLTQRADINLCCNVGTHLQSVVMTGQHGGTTAYACEILLVHHRLCHGVHATVTTLMQRQWRTQLHKGRKKPTP